MFDEKGDFLYSTDTSRLVLSLLDFSKMLLEPHKAAVAQGRARLAPEDRITIKDDMAQHNMALLHGTPYLFMVHPTLDRLTVLDSEKIKSADLSWGVSRIPTGRFPLHVAFTPDGSFALVNNALAGNMYIYDSAKAIREPEHALIGKAAIPSPTFFDIMPAEKN
jgi:hypothetical protein